MSDFRITWSRIAAIQRIESDDALGPRVWQAIYISPGRMEIHPEGATRDVAHSFPMQVRESLTARFAEMFAHPVEAREAAIQEMPAITWESLPMVRDGSHYIVHFLTLRTPAERYASADLGADYAAMCKRANRRGGRRYHCKRYGGGIRFQDYGGADSVARTVSELSGRNYFPTMD